MITYYLRTNGGDDSNTGSSYYSAFRSLSYAVKYIRDNESTQNENIVLKVYPGFYFDPGFDIGVPLALGTSNVSIVGIGNVVFMTTSPISWSGRSTVSGIRFENWSGDLLEAVTDAEITFYQCCFSAKGVYYQKINLSKFQSTDNSAVRMTECTIYGLNNFNASSNPISTGSKSFVGRSIIHNCLHESGFTYKSCGSNLYSINSVLTCFDTDESGKEPPFTSMLIPPEADIIMDKTHANFPFYLSASENGGLVGALGKNTIGWAESVDSSSMSGLSSVINVATINSDSNPRPFGVWHNDETYYNTSWEDILVQSGVNDQITIKRPSGNNLTITITPNTYTNSASLAAEIQSNLNTDDTEGNTYTVVSDSNDRLTISCDAAPFELLCSTEPSASPAWSSIGFDTGFDKSGSVQYTSEYPLRVGPGTGAEQFATRAVFSDVTGVIQIDKGFTSGGNNAKAVTDVIHLEEPCLIQGVSLESMDVGVYAAVDSSQSDANRTMEVRASNKLFDKFDAAGTTQLDWTEISFDMSDPSISTKYRYVQFRVHMRLNATNSGA